jgi:hypothetical protein
LPLGNRVAGKPAGSATLSALRRPSLADEFGAAYLVEYDGDHFTVVPAREGLDEVQ